MRDIKISMQMIISEARIVKIDEVTGGWAI